ncbi:VCBS domain-containing protein [Microvirga arabica]|uniref:VCBS domain-containing protein n=1 Tax=Microvirga arabica TaxID=1128671 RepID=UPI00193A41B0|nr:VCBS domain-containing protein [Microvirga arabica]MBM1171268.1 VCBS domain-containing protein [Microvirga arabica]
MASLDENNAPVITVGDLSKTINLSAGLQGLQSYEGAIAFTDADIADAHDVEVIDQTGNQTGVTFTPVIGDEPADGQPGQISWTLDVDPAVLNSLAAGEKRTLSYTLALTDNAGAKVEKEVTVTLVGANDAPVITVGDLSKTINLSAGLQGLQSYEGAIAFTDADIADAHDVEVIDQTGNQTGVTFTPVIGDEPADGQPGQISWTLDVDPAVLNSLAAGEKRTLSYTLALTDNAGAKVEKEVTVTLVGANDAPVAVALSATTVAENEAGAVVGNLSTSDVDVSDSFTYAVSDDRFEVINSELKLKAGVILDFENEPTVDLTVTSTDTGGLSKQQAFTLNVSDGNDAPTAVSLINRVTQTAENGATLKVADIAVADDGRGTNTLSLVGADAARFEIRGSALWFKGGADFETTKTSYAVQVKATDSEGKGEVTSVPFTLAITDVKEDRAVFNFKLTEAAFTFAESTVTINGPGGQHFVLSSDFDQFQFTDGTVNEADGKAVVSDLFYYVHNHDVWNAHVDADQHYAAFGWQEGRNPNAFFNTNAYLSANQDVDAANINPLDHYHQNGWKDGRDASVSFDTTLYLINNADVRNAGIDPLEHFLAHGRFEGRQAYTAVGLNVQGTFDAEYYLLANPDVGLADVDAAFHFANHGWREGRDPSAFFDTSAYLAAYADVAAAGVNPLEHYNTYGWKEGRDPSGSFDTSSYLATYADVAQANINPLEHYLKYGIYEGRSAFADNIIW